MRRRLVMLLSLMPVCVSAQMLDVRPGTRIKIATPGTATGTVVGVVGARNGDSITVLTSDPPTQYQLTLSSLTSLSVSNGRSRLSGAKKGLYWGLVIGVPLTVWSSFDSTMTVAADGRTQISKGEYIATTSLAFAAVGAAIGAIIGAESWSKYDIPARISAGPAGARIGASLRF